MPSLARNARLRLARAAFLSFVLCLLAHGAWAQVTDAQARSKIAPDLLAAISGSSLPALPWLAARATARFGDTLTTSGRRARSSTLEAGTITAAMRSDA